MIQHSNIQSQTYRKKIWKYLKISGLYPDSGLEKSCLCEVLGLLSPWSTSSCRVRKKCEKDVLIKKKTNFVKCYPKPHPFHVQLRFQQCTPGHRQLGVLTLQLEAARLNSAHTAQRCPPLHPSPLSEPKD